MAEETEKPMPEQSGGSGAQLAPDRAGQAPLPDLAKVQGWQGHSLEDINGAGVGKVAGCFVDAESGAPAWVLVKLGRFGDLIAVPLHDCAAIGSKVWTPYHRDLLREAPVVDARRPLNREQELTICHYFGIGEAHGRAAEIAGRQAGQTTSQAPPAAS